MHIIIDEIDRRIHFHSFAQQPVARPGNVLQAWWAGADAWQARSFVERHFGDTGRLHVLRHALTLDGADGVDAAQHADQDVIQAAVHRVSRGTWRIVCEVTPAPDVVRAVPAPSRSPMLGGGAGGRTRAPRPAPSGNRAPAAAPAPAPAVVPDWPDTAAQVAQATTLTRAARDGAPFCEICEARRRAAEQAAA